MNDDQLIERLRQTLNEVVETAPASVTGFTTAHTAPRRWLAVAAATLLFAGGAVWATTQRHREPDGAVSQPGPTVGPTTTETPTTSATTTALPPPAPPEPWYIIISPDVVPGAVLDTSVNPATEAAESSTVMAWAATTGPLDGLIVMTFTPPGTTVPVATPTDDYERSLGAGTVLRFRGFAMDDTFVRLLADQVVAGSGLPYVLPDPAMELLATGGDGTGVQHSQTYTNDLGTMTLTVGDYRGELADLTRAVSVDQVSVAGATGYSAFMPDRSFHIIWPAGGTGQWARLIIPASFGTIADGRIAAIVSTAAMQPASSVATPVAPTT